MTPPSWLQSPGVEWWEQPRTYPVQRADAESEGPDDAGVRMLAVAPDAGGQGIGTALVAHALELARRAGRRRMVLLTRPQMHAAHSVYVRLGFVRTPELDETFDDITLLGYARPIDSEELAADS